VFNDPRPSATDSAGVVAVPIQFPGVEPTDLLGLDAPTLAAGAFLLVVVVGGAVGYSRPALLDRAANDALDRPIRTPLYGVAATILGWLGAVYLLGQAFRLAGNAIGTAATVAVAAGALAVGGFGVAAVGTGLAAAAGVRRHGVVVGATVGALIPLALPAGPALALWTLVAAIGVGGPARRWLYASRSVERTDGETE
jgi:hypothetical protein